MQPAQLNLDGFTPASAKVTITKSTAQAMIRFDSLRRQLRFSGPAAALGMVLALLLFWPRRNYQLRQCAFILLIWSIGAIAGCGGSSSSATPTVAPGGPTPAFTVVTVTASGGSGATAVSHSVTLAVTLQ